MVWVGSYHNSATWCSTHNQRRSTILFPHGLLVSVCLFGICLWLTIKQGCITSTRTDMRSILRPTRTTSRICRQAMSLYTRVDHYGQGLHLIFVLSKMFNSPNSIIPCLSLQGVATAIARSRSCRIKILLRRSSSHSRTFPNAQSL